jgi:hypothetical protein
MKLILNDLKDEVLFRFAFLQKIKEDHWMVRVFKALAHHNEKDLIYAANKLGIIILETGPTFITFQAVYKYHVERVNNTFEIDIEVI